MKKHLFACLMAATTLLLAACGGSSDSKGNAAKEEQENTNYAEMFVGDYTVTYTGQVSAMIPTMGERSVSIPQREDEATIVLDGRDGRVKMMMGATTVGGSVDKDGLHLDNQSASDLLQPLADEYPVLSTATVDITLRHSTAPLPTNGTTSWTAAATGTATATALGITIPVTATLNYTATKHDAN